jgi:hypothetical protein
MKHDIIPTTKEEWEQLMNNVMNQSSTALKALLLCTHPVIPKKPFPITESDLPIYSDLLHEDWQMMLAYERVDEVTDEVYGPHTWFICYRVEDNQVQFAVAATIQDPETNEACMMLLTCNPNYSLADILRDTVIRCWASGTSPEQWIALHRLEDAAHVFSSSAIQPATLFNLNKSIH